MRALIIEDNPLTRFMIKALLRRLGHETAGEAENGADAVKAFADLRPDLVFLDIILPGKSGLEILAEIRKTEPGARVVVITAVVQKELDKKLLDLGAAAVIHKPFSYEEFKEALGRFV